MEVVQLVFQDLPVCYKFTSVLLPILSVLHIISRDLVLPFHNLCISVKSKKPVDIVIIITILFKLLN